jgi:hypothetical protein
MSSAQMGQAALLKLKPIERELEELRPKSF